MFQRVLTPLDGSEFAEAALPLAARIAQAGKGTLVLLHVLSGPREFLPYILPMMEPATLTADVDAASAYLAAVTERPDLAAVTTVTEVRSGLVAATILDVAEEHHADLVVLATHAHTGLARWALGNVAERIEHGGETPVLSLTEPAARPTSGESLHGLVVLDGTAEAEAAIAPAKALLAALSREERASATLRLAWIGAFEPKPAARASGTGDTSDVSRYLRDVEQRLHAEATEGWPLMVTSEVIAETNLPQAVADLATRKHATFIALAPHRTRGFPLYASADFDEHLRGATDLPLLLVPKHATGA
jgi:nucleotide-binding universal stress UspA family protein